MKDYFLKVDKRYFDFIKQPNLKLKSRDILLLAQIEEFYRSNNPCFMSNKTLAENFGESESSIKRSIDHLVALGFITRDTSFRSDKGQASKIRNLFFNKEAVDKYLTMSQTKSDGKVQNDVKQRSNTEEAKPKSHASKVHNEPIKDNKKEKLKNKTEDNTPPVLSLIENLGIKDVHTNTIQQLSKIVGEELDYYVLHRVIDGNRQDFQKAKPKGSPYIYGVLQNKLKTEYEETKRKMECEAIQAEQEKQRRKESRELSKAIQHLPNLQSTSSQDGLDDISEMLDELFVMDDFQEPDPVPSDALPASLQIIEKMCADSIPFEW